jgi:hypothetical protein
MILPVSELGGNIYLLNGCNNGGERMGNFAFIRNNNMKMGQVNNSGKHNERENKNYANESIDKTKSQENYHFKEPQGSYEQTFWKIKEENNYLGNLRLQGKKQSNVACEFIIDVNKDYFEKIGPERTKEYFKDSYDFCKDKCGEKNIISATVHMDEGHPHMHVVYVPVVKAKDRKGQDCERINCSKFWEGKDSYRILQDQFYEHTQKRGYVDLQRGEFKEDTQREHLTVDEFKADKIKQQQEQLDKLKKIDTEIAPPEKKLYLPKDIEELKTLTKSANLKRKDLEYENYELKQKVSSLTKSNIDLKESVKSLNVVIGENKDFKHEKKALEDYLEKHPQTREDMQGYFKQIERLQDERIRLYAYKKEYLTSNEQINSSKKLESQLKNEIGRQDYAIKDLGQRKVNIHELEVNLNIQKHNREELGGVKNLFRRSERKEVDNSVLEYENKLKKANTSLKETYNIEPKEIDSNIQLRKGKLSTLNEKLQDQERKTTEYTRINQKAEINYKYLDVKSKCYKDYLTEYVHADAKEIKANGQDYGLGRISAKEKDAILKQLPEEFQGRAKDILDPPKMAKTMTKSHDFMEH